MSGERIEAEFTVPAITTTYAVSMGVTNGALPGVSMTAGATFISDYLTDLQTQLNNNVQGYPQTAAAMQAAVGYGTWTSGAAWLCNESSGNLVAAFGSPNLTPNTTPIYGVAGPRGGIDKAVDFDSVTDFFSGGDVFNVGATDDIVLAWVGFSPTTGSDVLGKWNGGASLGYAVNSTNSAEITFFAQDGVDVAQSTTSAIAAGLWYVGIAVIDRSTAKLRVGVMPLTTMVANLGAEASTTLVGALTNAANFTLGSVGNFGAANTPPIAFAAVVSGSGVATSLSTNLSTALTNFANAVNSSFTVTRSPTTNLVTVSNSFWPFSMAASATIMDALGFQYDINYPQTAAQMATALGYGTWTSGAGWTCNESGGDLAPVFGSVTLADASTPTYLNQGARGGNDTAVGLDSAADAFGGGVSDFDVGSSDDLILVWVGKFTGTPVNNSTLVSKVAAAFASGWGVVCQTASLLFAAGASGAQTSSVATDYMVGQHHVGVAVVERSTGKLRIGIQSLTTGTQAVAAEGTASGSYTTAASFILGASAWTSQAAYLHVSALYAVKGSGVATGLSANLATALSNFATYMRSQTATTLPIGLWPPGGPLYAATDPKQAPIGDDKSSSISPTGRVYSMASSEYFRARDVRFELVERGRVWANQATVPGEDWETFYLETQLAHHDWFEVGSRVKIYWDNAGTPTEFGSGNVEAWTMPQCVKLDELPMAVDGFTGLFNIRLGDLYADE